MKKPSQSFEDKALIIGSLSAGLFICYSIDKGDRDAAKENQRINEVAKAENKDAEEISDEAKRILKEKYSNTRSSSIHSR